MKYHLRSSAKVNLSLDILSRRDDGYHELASVVHTVGLWDEITLEVIESGPIEFTCSRPDLGGQDNLCVRAVQLWNKETQSQLGAIIHLEKTIPTGAGLGGGSGNAAAVLLGLNLACGDPVTKDELRIMGAKLGADVPLFLNGGSVLMEGIGDILTPLPPLSGWLLIVKPDASFPTPAIYRTWDEGGFQSVEGSPAMREAVTKHDLQAVGKHLSNDLERAATEISDLPTALNSLLKRYAPLGAQMSGSGSACFALFDEQSAADKAAEQLRPELAKDVHLKQSQVFVAPLCQCGVEVAP